MSTTTISPDDDGPPTPDIRREPDSDEKPDTVIEIIQQVNNLNGTLVGAVVESVRGDLIEVKLYGVGSVEDRPAALKSLLVERRKPEPYKFLEPYTALDRNIFFGRKAEVGQVLRALLHNELVVVHGRAGIGKTSLMEAGVVPELMEAGALVLQVRNYPRPAAAILKALRAGAKRIQVPLPEGDQIGLPELVRLIVRATKGTLFLVFDQFELLFDTAIDDGQRKAFTEELAALADAETLFGEVAEELTELRRGEAGNQSAKPVSPSDLLRVVILLRDEALSKMAELQKHVPDLLKCHMPLLLLDRAAAEAAVEGPLDYLTLPVSYEPDVLTNYLLPDLDALTPEQPGVYPPHLQIVCRTLYEEAVKERKRNRIKTEAYRSAGSGGSGAQGKGAEGILARYMTSVLNVRLKDIRQDALEVLTQMALPGVGNWALPQQLQLKGVTPAESEAKVKLALEKLVKEQLLIRNAEDGETRYGFTSPIIAQEVRRISGPDAERRFKAEAELERVWAAWLGRDALATREQLRYLAEFGMHLRPHPVRLLFLLRSAAERGEPAAPWLERLRDKEGCTLVSQLELGQTCEDSPSHSLSILNNAETLLGLPQLTGTIEAEGSAAQDGALGAVARNAATNPSHPARQVSALALTVLSADSHADARLQAALRKLGAILRKRRQVELWGALADADPEFERLNKDLRWWNRLLIWGWRARRRLVRDFRRVTDLTTRGALGGALAVALLRALTAVPPKEEAGVQFLIYFYLVAIVAGAISFGLALARPLLTRPPVANDGDGLTFPSGLGGTLLAIALGTLGCGLVHLVFASMATDFDPKELQSYYSVVTGLVAGLGLSAAVAVGPRGGRLSAAVRWPLRLLITSLTMAFVSGYLLPRWGNDAQMMLTRSAGNLGEIFYVHFRTSEISKTFPVWWVSFLHESFDYSAISMLDAIFTGAALIIGTSRGLRRGEKVFAARRKRSAHADEF